MPGGRQLTYPENLSPGNLAYFVLAPTLCYQMVYPRSSRFRLRWTIWCAIRWATAHAILFDLVRADRQTEYSQACSFRVYHLVFDADTTRNLQK